MSYFFQLVVSGIVVGSIYALSALGFVLIYKSSRGAEHRARSNYCRRGIHYLCLDGHGPCADFYLIYYKHDPYFFFWP